MCNLYERIQNACASKGLTVSAMCVNLGMSKSVMSDLKSGRKKTLAADTVAKIASYLQVSTDYLLGSAPSEWLIRFRSQLANILPTLDTSDVEAAGVNIEELWTVAESETDLSFDRACEIADLLGVSFDYMIERETEKAPTVSGERSVSDDDIKFALFGGDGEISDAMYEEVRRFAAFVKQREADKKKE